MSGTTSATSTSVGNATAVSNSGTASSTGTTDLLASLTGNFQDFLSMLTTQLQNQDPTSPMDSSQFTSELVQFTGVEAQIQTNTSLTQLIQLTQGNAVMQSAEMLGQTVDVTSPQLSLQNGSATVDFTAPSAEPVSVAVSSSNGAVLYQTTLDATAGSNAWTWDGQSASGTTMPDGAYTVAVTSAAGAGTSGAGTALPFTVVGTVTGVQQNSGTVDINLGQLAVGVGAINAVQ